MTQISRVNRWNPTVPPAFPAWYNRDEELQLLLTWMNMKPQRPLALTGPKGCGKTSLIIEACHRANRKLLRINGHKDMLAQDLIGIWSLQQDKSLVWQEGPVPAAMRCGAVLLIDEFDRIPSGTLSVLQAVLEGMPLTIPETGDIIHPEQGFAIAASCNSVGDSSGGYSATFAVDEATLDRFEVVYRVDPPTKTEIERIMKLHVPHISAAACEQVVKYHMQLVAAHADGTLREPPSLRRIIAMARWICAGVDPVLAAKMCYTDRLDAAEGSAVAALADRHLGRDRQTGESTNG